MVRTKGTARTSSRFHQRRLSTGGKPPRKVYIGPASTVNNGESSTASTPDRRVTRSQAAAARLKAERAAALARATAAANRQTRPPRRPYNKRADPWYPKRKVNKNATPRPRAPPPTHFTCRICIEQLPANQFIPWVPPKRNYRMIREAPLPCIAHLARNPRKKHIDPVCKPCIGATMAARLDTLGPRKVGVGCVEPGCQVEWNHDLIMTFLPRGAPLEQFNMEMFDVWMQDSDPKPFTCLREGCDAIGLPDIRAAGYPQVSCHKCSFRSCANCTLPWHPDLTCSERAAKEMNATMTDTEKETLQLMQEKDGKRCPNCQLVIEKDGGCDSMYCMGCKKYFNWQAAASAVLGEKRALPMPHPNMYWQVENGTVVCEEDDIAEREKNGGTTQNAGQVSMNVRTEWRHNLPPPPPPGFVTPLPIPGPPLELGLG